MQEPKKLYIIAMEASFGNSTITSNGASDTYTLKLSTMTSIPNSTGYNISIYPNPFRSYLNIHLTTPDPAVAKLTDLLGRQVQREILNPGKAGSSATLTPVHDLPSGAYLLQVHQTNTVRQAMVVQV